MPDHREAAVGVDIEKVGALWSFASEAPQVPTPPAATLSAARRALSTLPAIRRGLSTLPQRPFRRPAGTAAKLGLSIFGCGVATGALIVSAVSRDTPTPAPHTMVALPAPNGVRLLSIAAPVAAATPAVTAPTVRPSTAARAPENAAEPGVPMTDPPTVAAVPSRARSISPGVADKVERPAGRRGTLVVESNPSGGRVFINSEFAGLTPLVLRAIPSGSRAVGVRLDGYTSWSRGVSVVANRSTRVVAQLARSRSIDQ